VEHSGTVEGVAASADGKLLATAAARGPSGCGPRASPGALAAAEPPTIDARLLSTRRAAGVGHAGTVRGGRPAIKENHGPQWPCGSGPREFLGAAPLYHVWRGKK
jgi:hypothetical protein